jgi:hypothetical protein
VKCHRNGFMDCWKEQCTLWLRYSGACGDFVVADLAQNVLADREEAEREKMKLRFKNVEKETLTIKCPEIHKVALSYE